MDFRLLLLIVAISSSHVTGDFILEVQVHAYSNPTHGASAFTNAEIFVIDCCDGQPINRINDPCVSICDNIFIFCFREAGRRDTNTTGDDGSNCPYGRSITEVIQNNDNLTFTVGENFPGGVPNPVVAVGQMWPGSIQLAIQILDLDFGNTEDDEVDIFFIDTYLTSGIDLSTPITYMGVNGFGQIQLSFRLNCTENYYGPDCATFCMERDDDLGHYTCGSDGSFVCLQGYQDPSSLCTGCIPAEECSPVGGFCNVPGECICFDGFDGDNCSVDTGSSGVAVGAVVGGVITGLLVVTIVMLTIIIIRFYSRSRKPTNTHSAAADGNEEPGLTEMTQNAAYIITTHPNEAYGQGLVVNIHQVLLSSAQNVAINHTRIHSTVEPDGVDEEGYEFLP